MATSKNLARDLQSETLRIWEAVQEDLCHLLWKYELQPSNREFREAVTLWLGSDTYEAFIEDYEE